MIFQNVFDSQKHLPLYSNAVYYKSLAFITVYNKIMLNYIKRYMLLKDIC